MSRRSRERAPVLVSAHRCGAGTDRSRWTTPSGWVWSTSSSTSSACARRRGLPLLVWTVDTERSLSYWMRPGRAWLVTSIEPALALRVRDAGRAGPEVPRMSA